MSSSALASLGLGVLTGDVYKKVLAVVIERDLGPDSVTNQFVLELKSYVAEQTSPIYFNIHNGPKRIQ